MTSPGLHLGKTEQLPDTPLLVLHCIFTIFVVPWYGPLPLGLLSMTPELGCLFGLLGCLQTLPVCHCGIFNAAL